MGKHFDFETGKVLNKYHWEADKSGIIYPLVNHKKLILPNGIPDAVDMEPHMSKLENQHSLGACTDHALTGMLEYGENFAAGYTNDHLHFVRLSRLFIYWNQRLKEGTLDQDAGAFIGDGVKSLAKYGICLEKFWEYKIRSFKIQPPQEAYDDAAKRKIRSYSKVEQTEEAILTTLAAGFPIAFGAYIYDSFESDETAKTGIVKMPKTTKEKSCGGHGILMAGFMRIRKRLFIKFRNSWGGKWGIRGYGLIPIEYVLEPELADDFWTVNVADKHLIIAK